MPVDPVEFQRTRLSQGVLDWTALPAEDIAPTEFDPVEIARAKNVARAFNPKSGLAELTDQEFLAAIKAVVKGNVTRAGLLLLGRADQLESLVPQHVVQYTHEISDTKLGRNDFYRQNLLYILERITEILTGPINPEQEIAVGLFKLRVPSFPVDVVREAFLNAVTHRDYSVTGKVLVRHGGREMVREYVGQHGSITNRKCRALLQLGESDSAITQASQYLKEFSGPGGFLTPEGRGRSRHYVARRCES